MISKTFDAFISHSSRDATAAVAIKAHLLSVGITCWKAPDDILPGESWPEAILRAIENSAAMILVWSANSKSSREVSKELTLAMRHNVPVIPFRIENVPASSEWEYHLANTHWMDAFSGEFQHHLDLLARHILKVIPNKTCTSTEKVYGPTGLSKSATALPAAGVHPVAEVAAGGNIARGSGSVNRGTFSSPKRNLPPKRFLRRGVLTVVLMCAVVAVSFSVRESEKNTVQDSKFVQSRSGVLSGPKAKQEAVILHNSGTTISASQTEKSVQHATVPTAATPAATPAPKPTQFYAGKNFTESRAVGISRSYNPRFVYQKFSQAQLDEAEFLIKSDGACKSADAEMEKVFYRTRSNLSQNASRRDALKADQVNWLYFRTSVLNSVPTAARAAAFVQVTKERVAELLAW